MTATTPLHMTGHFAPVPDEIDAVDLPVEGVLPPELTGRYFRNGPNPPPGEPSELPDTELMGDERVGR